MKLEIRPSNVEQRQEVVEYEVVQEYVVEKTTAVEYPTSVTRSTHERRQNNYKNIEQRLAALETKNMKQNNRRPAQSSSAQGEDQVGGSEQAATSSNGQYLGEPSEEN